MLMTIAQAIEKIKELETQAENNQDNVYLRYILLEKLSYERQTINVKIGDDYFNIDDLFKMLRFIENTDRDNPLIETINGLILDNYLTKTINY